MFQRIPIFALSLVFVAAVGCAVPAQRLNSPPQGASDEPAELQEYYVYMTDNAMLSDMSIVDEHFVPHTSEINSLGARRLSRYARLLETYRIPVRYDTAMDDEAMVEQRMQHVREYLQVAGLAPDRIEVIRADAGAKGMAAEESIMARKGSQYSEKQSQSPFATGFTIGSN